MENTTFRVSSYAGEAILEHQVSDYSRSPRIIMYNSTPIVYIDFSGLKKDEEIYSVMENASNFIRKHRLNSLYTLTNLTGMHFNNEIYSKFISYVKGNNPYVKASAVIGMFGLMQIFYNSFTRLTGRNVRACTTELEAKEFLASK